MPHLSFSGPCEMNLWLVWVLVSKLLLTDQGVEKREASKYEEGFVRIHGRREWVGAGGGGVEGVFLEPGLCSFFTGCGLGHFSCIERWNLFTHSANVN